MTNNVKSSPRDVFLHLLGFASLYVSTITLITLLFAYIDYLFPDRLSFYLGSILDQIRWSSSALIVIFPVFLLISSMLGKEFGKSPEKRERRFRKWLIYFTLFIAAVTIIVDLIMLIFNFYSGELTVKFFWKVLVVLLAAGGIFGYYRWELNRSNKQTSWPKTLVWMVSVIMGVAIAGGFFIVGSPATQRSRRFDEQRVIDLQTMQEQVIFYWRQKEVLPDSLTDLEDNISGFVPPLDPESGDPYGYTLGDVTDNNNLDFKLCADFKTNNQMSLNGQSAKSVPVPPDYQHYYQQQNWEHETGRVCFERIIDSELYRVSPKGVPLPAPPR